VNEVVGSLRELIDTAYGGAVLVLAEQAHRRRTRPQQVSSPNNRILLYGL
jgi:hypothetical protein